MRKIKFRVWIKSSKTLLQRVVGFVIDPNKKKFRYFRLDELQSDGISSQVFDLDDIELMQFTGREDSDINGTEVYEDDIIENCDSKDLQIVYWNENEAAWYCRYTYDKTRIVSLADSLGNLNKVVGNIHENPELFK